MIPDITRQSSAARPSLRLSPHRPPFEFYPTPPEATRAFLAAEAFDGSVWEPACGLGAISMELEAAGYETVSTDLADYGYGAAGCDFLKCRTPKAKHIVTNPPYGAGLADRFVRQALNLTAQTGGKVAMLLNLNSLCHPGRHESFMRRPPARLYGLDNCVCYPNGDPALATRRTREHRYVWAVWTPEPVPQTTFHWLTTAPYRKEGA